MDNQQYIILFVAILIISAIIYFVVYKKDEEEENNTGEENNNNTGEEGKIIIKITDSGVKIPKLPTTETYTHTTIFPCDNLESKIVHKENKDGEIIETNEEAFEKAKAWCQDLGIPIDENIEVVGFSPLGQPGEDIFTQDKDIGCLYGDDKKGCVYVQKKNKDGYTIGIKNNNGDNFLDVVWKSLENYSKMKEYFKEEFGKYYTFKVDENGTLNLRPKPTSRNCKRLTGKSWVLKPGQNVPIIQGLFILIIYLNLNGYSKEELIFDMKFKTLKAEEIRINMEKMEKEVIKDEDDVGPDMCTDDIVWAEEEWEEEGGVAKDKETGGRSGTYDDDEVRVNTNTN